MLAPICHPTLICPLLDCLREPWPGEETVSLWGIPVRVSSAQPPDLITLRSFRSDGSVLDEQHLKVIPKGSFRTPQRPSGPLSPQSHPENNASAKGSHPGRSDNNVAPGK